MKTNERPLGMKIKDFYNMKFDRNDMLRRKDYPEETYKVLGAIEEESNPFYVKVWYILEDRHGKRQYGLQGVVEDCCELMN